MTDSHTDFVQRWAALWKQPRMDEVRVLVHPDVVLRWPGLPGPVRGSQGWDAVIGGVLARYPDLRIQPTGQAANDDTVFISWRASATVAGTPIEWDGMDRITLRDGLAIDELVVFDTASLAPGQHPADRSVAPDLVR